jgi:hypothetical protein
MSDVVTKRRPMIDWDEFEKRLNPPISAHQKEGDALAELLRIIADKVEPHFESTADLSKKSLRDAKETGTRSQTDVQTRQVASDFAAIEAGLLGTKQPQAGVPQDAERSAVAYKRPDTRAPLIGGDFAAIEAALLSGLREQAAEKISEPSSAPNALPGLDAGADRWLDQERQPASRLAGDDADGQVRSRRPLYAMVALIIAGMVGIAVSSGLGSRVSGQAEIAAIKADAETPARLAVTTTDADIPAKEVAILDKPQEPSPAPIATGSEQTPGVPQADAPPPAGPSQAQIELPAVPPAPAPAMAEPPVTAASAEPVAVKNDLAGPEGAAQISNGTPPQANLNEAPPVVSESPAAAKPPVAKAAGHVAKPKAAAAKHPGGHGKPPHQVANAAAHAAPVRPLPAEPAPSADLKAAAPAAAPSPAPNGAFGFVQSAVNSLTNTTAKLMEWGGARP